MGKRYSSFAALLACSAISLSACASISAAPAGAYKVGTSGIELGRVWSNVSSMTPRLAKQARVLSVDGPLLNRLYIVDGLPAGRSLTIALAKDRPMPTVRANMSAIERVEFVAESVAANGYQRVETTRLRPGKLGDVEAIRFDLTARTAEGLDISGTASVAERAGKLYLILYLAPTEHYYRALLPEVEHIMTSAKLAPLT